MSRIFPPQLLLLLSLVLSSLPAYAGDGTRPSLWPWLSVLLTLFMAAAIFFCFWLQKQITQWQHRLLEQQVRTENTQKQLEDLQAEDRFRSRFFQSSSHELRTPLNGLIGFLQLMIQGQYGNLPPAGRNQISKCIMLAEAIKHQITTILDLVDGRRGTLQLQNSRISLPHLMLEMEAMAEGLRLRYPDCHFEGKKLWMDDDCFFIQDHTKLLMILRNLVGNAFKFSKPYERNQVVLAISKRNRSLIIEVSDQGMGLTSEQISRVFDDERRVTETSGLGLAMVRILVRLMQGEMKISSEPGLGSRFTLVIPEQEAMDGDASPAESIPPAASTREPAKAIAHATDSPPSQNLLKMDGYAAHILVVDDNEINCEIIQEILKPHGYRVSLAYGGREALTRMRSDRPDLVLLDLAMPEFSGEHVMQEKQLDNSLADIPTILITARASDDDRIHGLDLGVDDYLTKPIIQQELVLRVRNLLSRQRLSKRIALMEERDKLAQLGEMVTDLSREIRLIYADRNMPKVGRELCQQALEALPESSRLGPRFSHIFLTEHESGDEIDLETLPLPRTDPESLSLLRSLRLHLAPSQLSAAEKTGIWQTLQDLTEPQLRLVQRVTALAAAHIHLMDQSQRARLLVDGILEFHQSRGTEKRCRVDQTLTRTANLMGPRLRLTGVRLNMTLPQATLMMHPADLMQIGISLITSLCHRLEMLLDQDKWLEITGTTHEDQVLLRLTCGGPRLTEAQALRLFDPVAESTEDQVSSSLQVARRIVLRASGRLDVNLNEATTCFELELPQALTGIE